MAEHRFCKPVVVGSTPTASFPGEPSSWKWACEVWCVDLEAYEQPFVGFRERMKQTGRWPSGQWHQTVNLTDYVLRGFKSLPAHSRKG